MENLEASYSIFVRDLQFRSLCVPVAGSDLLRDLRASLQELTGVPQDEQLLLGRHAFNEASCLAEQGVTPGSTLHLTARLRGGKGGFGSLLRGSGKAALTENEDACRDLSGRRLRLVNADKKLKDWAAAEKQRRDEKQAAKDERDRAKAEIRAEEAQVNLDAIRKDQSAVIASVAKALESSRKTAPKRAVEDGKPAKQPAVKKTRYSSESEDEDAGTDGDEEDGDVDGAIKPQKLAETKELGMPVEQSSGPTNSPQIPVAT